MNALYDNIGKNYQVNRCTDPKIAKPIFHALENADYILNIGAGTGSYEPANAKLQAVEPSVEMIRQRTSQHPVTQAFAENLPFEDKAFSHTMTVLSIHHWQDRAKGFSEVNRVTTKKFVALTWMPDAGPFWLTRDYFPEVFAMDEVHFPLVDEFKMHFDNVRSEPVCIPADCKDGFLAAFWKRPGAYIDANVRQSISSFSKIDNIDSRIKQLHDDIQTGQWAKTNQSILALDELDLGYRLITADVR